MERYELTDESWASVEPLWPADGNSVRASRGAAGGKG